MIKVLALSGSPVEESSTDLILQRLCARLTDMMGEENTETTFVRLNERNIMACQSCGEAPADSFCFYEDGITDLYDRLADCDCLLFGSPIYFDTVSAQAKLFIDRCNCVRPPDFDNTDPQHLFLKRLDHKRPGAMVLVGGEKTWFEGARRTIAGFFKWVEVYSVGLVSYSSPDYNLKGTAIDAPEVLEQIEKTVADLAGVLKGDDVRS